MSEKRSDPRDEKIIDAFSELLDLDLLPRSIDEAEEALRAANINIDELNRKSLLVLRELSKEFEDDWRNISAEEISSVSTNLDRIPLDLSRSKDALVQRIQRIIAEIASHNEDTLVSPGLAWRNLDKQSNEDLARLLRKIEFIANELGIDQKKD